MWRLILNPWRLIAVLLAGLPMAVSGQATLQSILAPAELPVVEALPVKRASEPVAPQVQPQPASRPIGLEAVLARLEQQVRGELGEGDRLSLSSQSRMEPLELGASEEWDLLLKNAFSPDSQGIWFAHVDLLVEGEVEASLNLRIKASLFQEVWMVQQRLIRGTIPDEAALRPVMRDIFLERGNPVPASEDLGEFELLRTLPEGRLLSWADLTRRPSVRRGDLVEVVVEQGALTVTMRARSMEDGLLGESVAVKNLMTNREVVGTVIGPDRVRFIP